MRNSISISSGVVAVSVLLTVTTSNARSCGPGHGKGDGESRDVCIEKLGLTPEQGEKVKEQRRRHRRERRKFHELVREKRHAIREELGKGDPDEKRLQAMVAELKKLEAERIDERVRGILAMKENLTSEQFAKLSAFEESKRDGKRDEFQERHRKRRRGGHRKMMEELELSQEQREELRSQREKHSAAVEKNREEIEQTRRQLHDELEKPETDEGAVSRIVARLKKLEAEKIQQRIESVLSMKKTLTPAQFEKFQSHKKDRMEGKRRHRRRKGKGDDFPPPPGEDAPPCPFDDDSPIPPPGEEEEPAGE